MAKLTSKGRKRIKSSNFALPAQRKFPIHDISHARNALARVANKSSAIKAKVRRAVFKKFPSLKKK